MTNSPESPKSASSGQVSGWWSIQWWPSLIGLAFAAFLAIDLFSGAEHGTDLAAVVAASGLVYLAAAALELPWVSWPVFFLSVVVITLVRLGLVPVEATWLMLAAAALFAAIGLARAARRPIGDLPLQASAMMAFGGAAAVALLVSPFIGALLVAAGLFGHAGWDLFHHAKNKVVVRSMAEFCFVFDCSLGLAIVIVTLRGA